MSAALQTFAERPAEWRGAPLHSPTSGQVLRHAGPNRLVAAGEAWPVIDGIPYLHAGRMPLVQACLAAIDIGALDRAAALLLDDEDRAEAGEPTEQGLDLVTRRDSLGFREAMRMLGYGALCDDLAHRWTDPGYLAGLALAEAYWPARASGRCAVLEVGCGAGHFLRAFLRATQDVTGVDGVFSRLWLARHWVAPAANLACFDLARTWPIADAAADLVFCQGGADAAAPAALAGEMQRVAAPGGALLFGHVARTAKNHAATSVAASFGRASLHDEAELVASLIQRRAPRARPPGALAEARTIAIAAGGAAGRRPAPVLGLLDAPSRGAALRRNPLYCEQDDGTCVRRFPSQRYAEEYAGRVTYPAHVTARARVIAGADPADDALIRRRVWVDLPARW